MVENTYTTENQIFEAALKVFHKKGLAGARMQEIADEAGINKSMLHYYFRSKDQLFGQIFMQSFKKFIGSVAPLLNEQNTWEEKIPAIIDHYAGVMQNNPDLPLFVINELHKNAEGFRSIVKDNSFLNSVFIMQLKQAMQNKEIRSVNPIQIWMTIVSGIVFPFIAAPMIKITASLHETDWDDFVHERKKTIADMLIKYLKEF